MKSNPMLPLISDLYRWSVDRQTWKIVESLNTPPPRCSHQAVYFKDKVYVFGGTWGFVLFCLLCVYTLSSVYAKQINKSSSDFIFTQIFLSYSSW